MNKRVWEQRVGFGLAALLLVFWSTMRFGVAPAEAKRISDIRGTKHNLSATADGSTYTRPDGSTGTVPGTGTIPGTSLMPRNIKAASETQVCVFCHTPHGATSGAVPLWNRNVTSSGYTMYSSSSLDALQVQTTINQPGGSSKLCLSCHDGTIAIGSVNVLNGSGSDTPGTQTITTTSTDSNGTKMPVGSYGSDTGFTRNLGTDLSNDHPISISYNSDLATADGELRTPNGTLVGASSPGVSPKPTLPLENTGLAAGLSAANDAQIQCATCHDPHILETDYATVGNQKFLRLNRFQEADPRTTGATSGFDSRTATAASAQGDIICLACHDKNNRAGSFAYSVHANPDVGDEAYSDIHADRREFRRGIKVWQAACLNCHDTHTVAGARRLLREGVYEGTSTAASPKSGGKAALEETCYQCHDGGGNGTLTSTLNVPNIQNDFVNGITRMPITNGAQGNGGNSTEVHDINSSSLGQSYSYSKTVNGVTTTYNYSSVDCTLSTSQCGKDFIESPSNLGNGDSTKRHVECTDCHNPHRIIRAQNGLPGTLGAGNTANTVTGRNTGWATHLHSNSDTTTIHSNVISGALRGSWGVEPKYISNNFGDAVNGYVIVRGDPGSDGVTTCNGSANKGTCDAKTYVTREYQICLKCHSDYGFGTTPPNLGYSGGTVSGTNGLTKYTNVAKEIQAPTGHQGEVSTTDSGAGSDFSTNNHRSWHPVMDVTGRTLTVRAISQKGTDSNGETWPWHRPWSNNSWAAVGTQTMYCTDCHGSDTGAASESVIPADGKPWGPHGSNNAFILKGNWNQATVKGATGQNQSYSSNFLCFKCHDKQVYADGTSGGNGTRGDASTGFCCGGKGNLHQFHTNQIQKLRCTWCHIAVPHGWKNKAFLVNLNDIGPEAGQASSGGVEVNIPRNKSCCGPNNGTDDSYSKEPYYYYAKLKVVSFAASGQWQASNCGSKNKSGGTFIANTSGINGTGNYANTGKDWMTNTCFSPP